MLQPPVTGERRAVAAEPGLHHAVELVDAEGDRLDQRRPGRRRPSGSGAVGRQVVERRSQRGEHLVAGLPHRQPTDAVAVEVELHRALGATPPASRRVDAALDDAEQRLVGPAVGGRGPRRPRRGALDARGGSPRAGDGRRRAHVEHHLDVGAEQLLVATADSGVKRCVEPS